MEQALEEKIKKTAESMLSKHLVLRAALTLFFLLQLVSTAFSSRFTEKNSN